MCNLVTRRRFVYPHPTHHMTFQIEYGWEIIFVGIDEVYVWETKYMGGETKFMGRETKILVEMKFMVEAEAFFDVGLHIFHTCDISV